MKSAYNNKRYVSLRGKTSKIRFKKRRKTQKRNRENKTYQHCVIQPQPQQDEVGTLTFMLQ